MKMENKEDFQNSWGFDRGLSLDLLKSLSEEELLFTPHPTMGPFWKQFRHLGRVEECYIEAIEQGKMNYNKYKQYKEGANKDALLRYLEGLDQKCLQLLSSVDWEKKITWWGEAPLLGDHLARMNSHEILHHGQFIVYMNFLGKKFPSSWSAWGF